MIVRGSQDDDVPAVAGVALSLEVAPAPFVTIGFRLAYDTPDVMPALGGCVLDHPYHVRASGSESIRVHLQFQTERFGFRLVKEGT